MNNFEIQRCLQSQAHTLQIFKGVFCCDTLPKYISGDVGLYISNTDPSTAGGSHWVLFYFDEQNAVFFDSYGKKPEFYSPNFLKFLKNNMGGKKYNTNSFELQSLVSSACGQYTLYVSYYISRGRRSLQNITTQLRRINPSLVRDVYVIKFVKHHFNFHNRMSVLNCGLIGANKQVCIKLEDALLSHRHRKTI